MFDDHLVVILQVPLVNKSFCHECYKAYNMPILHPILQKAFQYSLQGKQLAISYDGDYAAIPSEHSV